MSTTPYQDGTFTAPKQYGPRIPGYPFANTEIPDAYPRTYEREMMVLPASYSPQMAVRSGVTNYWIRSEEFDNAAWTKVSSTVTANTVANPNDGALTGDSLLEAAATTVHYVSQGVTLFATATSMSVFVKANGRDYVVLQLVDSLAASKSCSFNLAAGTVGTPSAGSTASIISCGNGWYRCTLTFTSPASGSATGNIITSTDGITTNYLGDVTKGLYLWGAQIDIFAQPAAYIPTTASPRMGSAPNLEINEVAEGSDPLAFLVDESELSISRAVANFRRKYARVPGDQIVPGNQWVQRPVMHNIKSGTSYAVSFDDLQKYSWVFTSRKSVTRVSSVNSQTIAGAMPSTNIVFVEGAHTLNLPANSTAAFTVSQFGASLTGLTSVAANAQTGSLSIVWTGTMASITVPAGVIITSISGWQVTFQSTGTQTTPATTTFTAVGHGGLVGDRVALWSGDDLVGTGTVVSVGDADNFTMMTENLSAANTLVTHCAFSTDAAACYVNGPKLCTVKRTQKFYLPGVTMGIATYADIPDVTIYTDPIGWLGRIIAVPTGYAAIAVSDLGQWMGPILTQETSEVQMSDAIDTVTP